MEQPRILLLDFNPAGSEGHSLRGILESASRPAIQLRLETINFHDSTFSEDDLSVIAARFRPEVIFLVLASDLLKHADRLFQALGKESAGVPVIIVIEAGESEEMFTLLKLGAADFITPPMKAIDILPRVWRVLEQARRKETLADALKERLGLKQLIGESRAFLTEIKKIPLIARCDASVLILGETGTGKELCARALHHLSPRAHQPFVPINCGAIPLDLVENELFGHQRGAFTNASSAELGLIREADGGTLFLDEIDCLSLMAQVKLLRFLQDKEYRPLGSTKMCKANVRIIAATNTDLEKALSEGRLRQDLYYRLNTIPLTLPPLRERREDILPLARHFLAKYEVEFNKAVKGFSEAAGQALACYGWPGNVRELEHVVERAVVLSEREVIGVDEIILPQQKPAVHGESFQQVKTRMIAQFEKNYIQELLLAYQGNITKAAQAARKNRRSFWQLIHKYGINVKAFKPSH